MMRGFYETIGIAPEADLEEIRAAYRHAVAYAIKRREATRAAGGDTEALDLARAQLDEAWDALSDPVRRRRYDAMLAVVGDGVGNIDIDTLWTRVAGAMVHPSVAAAARLVDSVTDLNFGSLPEPPKPSWRVETPNAWPAQDAREVSTHEAVTRTKVEPFFPGDSGSTSAVVHVVTDATTPTGVPDSFDTPQARNAPDMRPDRATTLSGVEIAAWVDELGYSGALVRRIREARGLTYADLREKTSLTEVYFEAIEAEDLRRLPTANAYLQSYLRKVAAILGLDTDKFSTGYLRRVRDDS